MKKKGSFEITPKVFVRLNTWNDIFKDGYSYFERERHYIDS